MDGNSEGYFLYGFVVMNGITCQSGDKTIDIDISEMADPEYAYGMFTSTVDPRRPTEKIGTAGQVIPRRAVFVKDKYYVELAANPEGDHTAALRTYVAILEKNISGQNHAARALDWFPTENLVAGSVRLVPESVLGLRLLRKGYVGQYSFGKGFLVQEASPEAAADTMAQAEGTLRPDDAAEHCGRGVHGDRQVPQRSLHVPQGALRRRTCESAGWTGRRGRGDEAGRGGQIGPRRTNGALGADGARSVEAAGVGPNFSSAEQ